MRNHFREYWSDWLCGFVLFAMILIGVVAAAWKPAPRPTCDAIDTFPCECPACICERGGRCCESCKHLLRPDDQAVKDRAGLEAFAERLKAGVTP